MRQEPTTEYGMHPASKWVLGVAADRTVDTLTLRVAVLLAAWWINHDRPPRLELIDQVRRDLGADRAPVQRAFATLWTGHRPQRA